jgi:hypothetical protein
MGASCGASSAASFTTSPVSQPLTFKATFLTGDLEFSFDSEEEKQALLGLMRGNNFQAKDLDEVDMPVFLSRLAPYRCGYLRQEAPATPRRQRTFTLRELGRYIFPEIGMYCAIDGEVYDLGRKHIRPASISNANL